MSQKLQVIECFPNGKLKSLFKWEMFPIWEMLPKWEISFRLAQGGQSKTEFCKLYDLGIKGSFLRLLDNYLDNRQMKIAVNTKCSRWKTSNVGLPQGGVNSPKLANVYSKDSDPSEVYKHAEFADDNIKLEMDRYEYEAAKRMQVRLNHFNVWLKKNNLSFGTPKIRAMTFRPPESPRPYNSINLNFNGSPIIEVDKYRILGTLLTSELNFDEHFVTTIKSAYEALRLIKLFSINQRQPREHTITTLYKSLILTKVDSSVVACVNISPTSLKKLQMLQRDCLIAATQCKNQISAEVLNLITNTLPIDLHLKRRAAEDLCRIASRDNDVINAQFDAWDDWFNNNDGEERRCSSFRKMTMAYSHITKHDFCTPEKVSLFHAKISPLDNLKIIMESVEKEAQIKNINNLVNSGKFDYIVSTDGSSFPKDGSRLGKTGAAAIIWHKKDDGLHTLTLSTPVSCMSNNYEGELAGINLGLSFIDGQNIQNSDILVLCDCIPAITASFSDNSHIDKEYNQVIQGNKLLV